MKKKKLYYLPTYGQLGNQLSVLAHLVAFAIEYDYKIILFKEKYLYQILKKDNTIGGLVKFSNLLSNSFFSFCINKAIVVFFFNRNKRFLNSLFINQPFVVDTDLDTTRLPRYIAITDWLFRYYSGVVKYQDLLRNQLSFEESSFDNAKHILKNVSENFSSHTSVGVHVRRGDYATWFNGKYFYDNTIYYRWMKSLASQLGNPVFIICSNEKINFDNDANLSIIYANGSPAEDIFLLSKCSYIIGPPSTFSSYAAFLGNQNYLCLESKEEDVTLSSFKKYYMR